MTLWILLAIMFVAIIALSVKIYYIKKSISDIHRGVSRHLVEDTNVLISVSSRDKDVQKLANELNKELNLLREQRLKFVNGDKETKDAITNIAHDLRTPLTAVLGYLDLLESEEKSENVDRYISFIKNRADTLKVLTEEMFSYSVIMSTEENIKLEKLNVNNILEECIASFYTELVKKEIEPKIDITKKIIIKYADKTALNRVFSNIISNACRYSDGDLYITAKDNGEIIFANTSKQLNQVQVGRLFDRFYSVNSATKGTGLGLAISKTLVEYMGGEIRAEYKNDMLSVIVNLK